MTKTFLTANLLAVNVNDIVIVAYNPSGILATIIDIANTKLVIALYPNTKPNTKNMPPKLNDNTAIYIIKRSISFLNGDISAPAEAAKFAI